MFLLARECKINDFVSERHGNALDVEVTFYILETTFDAKFVRNASRKAPKFDKINKKIDAFLDDEGSSRWEGR